MSTKSTQPADQDNDTLDTKAKLSQKWHDAAKVLAYASAHAQDKKLTQVASSLTFTTVLALVPMLAVFLSLFTAFPLFSEFRDALENFLVNSLMPPTVSETVMRYLNMFAEQASGLTAIGTVFLLVVSIMLIMAIDTVLNDIWQVEQQRPLPQRILVYWAIISAGPILAGASLWATSFLAQQSAFDVGQVARSLRFALSVIPVVITGLAFSALFVFVPNRHVFWRDALAGGFGTAIVLEIMKSGFAFYITQFPSYTIIYGAFATLPIFLLWIYLSWLVILFGATVAATLPSLRLRRWAEKRKTGAAFIDAVRILRLLRSAQNTPNPGRSTRFLGAHLRLHANELLSVLRALKHLGIVVPTQEKGMDHWVLASDIRETKLSALIDQFLLDRHQPELQEDPFLLKAVAHALSDCPNITLEDVFDETIPLSEKTELLENKEITSKSGETHHA